MKESVSYTYLLNMMAVFLFVAFCILMATISYTKAFRLNSKIANAIEEYEGYNEKSKEEIGRLILSFGYQGVNVNCRNRNFNIAKRNADGTISNENLSVPASAGTNGYCIYEVYSADAEYYYYGITTYMFFDFPMFDLIKLPVYNTTEKIYNMTNSEVDS